MKLHTLIKNLRLKILALLLGTGLFVIVNVDNSSAVNTEITIDYKTDSDILITGEVPGRLAVTLKGPWVRFRRLQNLEPLLIDLRDVDPGVITKRINLDEIRTPFGMDVVSANPSQIEIALDRRIEKWVSIEVDPKGRPLFGYEISEIRTKPARVKVVGPQQKIRSLDFIYTRSVDLTDRESSLELDVALRPPPPPVRILGNNGTRVFVQIREEIVRRTMELKVKLVGTSTLPTGLVISPKTVMVIAKGPRLEIDKMAVDSFAEIELSDELASGALVIEKAVTLSGISERVQLIGSIPIVKISFSANKGSKKKRHKQRSQ